MSTDLEIIKQIEKTIGQKLEQFPLIKLENSHGNGYDLDSNRKVIGLNLDESNLTDISFLSSLNNLTHLFLFNNQINNINPLSDLKNITYLDLSYNDFSDISPLKELAKLTKLYVNNNGIADISPIVDLRNLTLLDISENRILDILQLMSLTKLEELNASSNEISNLAPIKNLTNLEIINVSYNQIADLLPVKNLKILKMIFVNSNLITDWSPLNRLKNLEALTISHCNITDLSHFKKLENLRILDASFNKITDLSSIKKLKQLQKISVHSNQISDLTPISNLINLKYINLRNNKINNLSPLKNLKKLQEIQVCNNLIRDISPLNEIKSLNKLGLDNNLITDISPLKELSNLESLNLSNNSIEDMSSLEQLNNLNSLDLKQNSIKNIPPLSGLRSLSYLDASYNQIVNISISNELHSIKELYFHFNKITETSSLKGLKNLKSLGLGLNHISDISPLKELKNLQHLDLSDNCISNLPCDISEWPTIMGINWDSDLEGGIFLEGNPLVSPPVEIVEQGRDAVAAYFKAMEGEKKALNEVKVLLVGDGGAGKTSLVKRLMGKGFSSRESQTQGINIKHWPVKSGGKEIKVRTWDFGGQEIMHATHQFFLSRRSLYILVLDCRKDAKVEYWLKHIQSFGGDSPVMVVINKIDENAGFDVNRVFLQEKYPNIKGFFKVSCANNDGIETFSQHLINELAQVELIHSLWPKTWFNMKERLENMKDHFISYAKFKSLCLKENIADKAAQETLVDYLNDLGIILHFNEFKLKHTHVLEPHWVTKAVYKIITSPYLANSKGLLKLELLGTILKKEKPEDFHYPPEKHKFIIDLMQKFQLCYEINDSTILIPDLLEIGQPEFEFDYKNSLRFQIEYDFLPRSIMPRFIVKMHRDIDHELRWRTGVVLKDDNLSSTAVVTADIDARTIYIYVQGHQKRDYFAIILKNLRDIHNSFEKLDAIEKVPMPGEPHVTVSYAHLLRLEKKGTHSFMPDGSENEYVVKELLGSLYTYNQSDERILNILEKLKEQSDTQESLLKKADNALIVQPNFFGVGIDLKKVLPQIKKLFNKKTNKKRPPKKH